MKNLFWFVAACVHDRTAAQSLIKNDSKALKFIAGH